MHEWGANVLDMNSVISIYIPFIFAFNFTTIPIEKSPQVEMGSGECIPLLWDTLEAGCKDEGSKHGEH